MKKAFALLLGILPHVTLVLALMMLTFFAIDCVNPYMAFLNNGITKVLLAVFSLFSLILSLFAILQGGNDRK